MPDVEKRQEHSMKAKGVLICVEGLDGCGKTTQTSLLVERLRKKSFPAVYTAEPSHGTIGEFIRKHYLHGRKTVRVL
jgi:dTMP kinase